MKNTTIRERTVETTGFGCPIDNFQHFVVTIPQGRGGLVTITECWLTTGHWQSVSRVQITKVQWRAIASHAKSDFNQRLREKSIRTGRWQTGENKVDRLLGKELAVLAWAIEFVESELIEIAIKNWAGLRPTERWWLFTMTAAATGGDGDGYRGWRKALRYALTENPV